MFACLGIALALHGRRAVRARILNLASVGTSLFMNTIAAAAGWPNLAVWAMPPVAYALASDTLIGVVRAAALARHRHLDAAMAPEERTPLAVPGGLAHIREVERLSASLPEGSYGRRNRRTIAARETRVATMLRAVDHAYLERRAPSGNCPGSLACVVSRRP